MRRSPSTTSTWHRQPSLVGLKLVACVVLLVGILAQSGGFFLHMLMGKPGRFSAGNMVTILGAVLLVSAALLLAYGLIVART